jgi:hypothetical protein
MPAPVRYPNGVAAAPRLTLFGDMPIPHGIRAHEYSNDFDQYVAADWTITTSTGSNALTSGNGGRLLLSTAAGAADIQAITKNPGAFAFVAGSPVWFSCLFQTNDLASDVRAGLVTGGTPFAPTDGVFFESVTATGVTSLNIKTGGATTTIAAVATRAAATDIVLGFYYDGAATPTLYVYSSAGLSQTAFGQPAPMGGQIVAEAGALATVTTNVLTNLPASVLSPMIAIRATPVAIKTCSVDYLYAANAIARY